MGSYIWRIGGLLADAFGGTGDEFRTWFCQLVQPYASIPTGVPVIALTATSATTTRRVIQNGLIW